MVRSVRPPSPSIALRIPIIVLVIASIAIPIELRSWSRAELDFDIQASEIAINIVGFLPIGIVLGELGFLRAVILGTLISAFAEASQFVMVHRVPSPIDVAANFIGAALGALASTRWKIPSPELKASRRNALVAAALALTVIFGLWVSSGQPLNDRGAISPGALEAHWKLDESGGRTALDSARHGLRGRLHDEPKPVAGVLGGALNFDGANDYVDFAQSSALRLVGSMTISAWINSSSFPVDDAAIVSQLRNGKGYQLDTTVDQGPRTVGFKLTNACGDFVARYGATPLSLNKWYHVAGVYDAEARRLDAYLNGELDNGFLRGSVTGTQYSSRSAVHVARRSDRETFEFAGFIDDVRIYSFALTKAQIAEVMRGGDVHDSAAQQPYTGKSGHSDRRRQAHLRDIGISCAVLSDPQDAKIPAAAAAFGVLVAVALAGLWPSVKLPIRVGIGVVAGLLLVPATAPTLPSFGRWMMPLVSYAGGISVAASVRRQRGLRI